MVSGKGLGALGQGPEKEMCLHSLRVGRAWLSRNPGSGSFPGRPQAKVGGGRRGQLSRGWGGIEAHAEVQLCPDREGEMQPGLGEACGRALMSAPGQPGHSRLWVSSWA